MRIGYGYKRRKADLEAAGAEKFYLDGDQTRREERVDLFRDLRSGDTLVLIAMSDLGAGKGLRNMRAEIERRGVAVEVVEPAKAEEPKPMGRPRAGGLSQEDWDGLEVRWRDVSVDGAYLLDEACKKMGEDQTDRKARERVRQRLLRKFGPRR